MERARNLASAISRTASRLVSPGEAGEVRRRLPKTAKPTERAWRLASAYRNEAVDPNNPLKQVYMLPALGYLGIGLFYRGADSAQLTQNPLYRI